jgi:small subunit ribosomal protein S4
MAKATMGRSRFKIQRRLGVELPGLGKPGSLERRPYPPGQHGQKRKKLSEYTIRLMEKQKLAFHYGLRESQLRKYVLQSKKDKSQSWIDTMIQTFETRLDNVVFRSNFSPSILASRQMIKHGHVLVNGKKVSIPSFQVKVGDKVELKTKASKNGNYLQAIAKPRMGVPGYLKKEPKGEVEISELIATPLPEDIPFEFNKQLVIEFYFKVK